MEMSNNFAVSGTSAVRETSQHVLAFWLGHFEQDIEEGGFRAGAKSARIPTDFACLDLPHLRFLSLSCMAIEARIAKRNIHILPAILRKLVSGEVAVDSLRR